MRQSRWKSISIILLSACLTGCATKVYQPPISQGLLDAQFALNRAIERNIRIDPEDVRGFKVDVVVHADSGLGKTWGFERYLLKRIEETLTRKGGFVSRDADRRLVIFAVTSGTSSVGRRLSLPTGQGFSIPIWYSETSEGMADFLVLYQDNDRKTIKAQLNTQTADVRDIFLFYWLRVPNEILNE